ncbi:MAG: hypothetical protein IKZ26_02835 [Peptococcaceae bacterium]|nr:hypothetical protein [Peptococcaceae bacterium]
MSENLGFGWGNNCNNICEERCNFGGGCNGSFFETLIMLIIIIWLLRWLFSCGIFGSCNTGCGCNNGCGC